MCCLVRVGNDGFATHRVGDEDVRDRLKVAFRLGRAHKGKHVALDPEERQLAFLVGLKLVERIIQVLEACRQPLA